MSHINITNDNARGSSNAVGVAADWESEVRSAQKSPLVASGQVQPKSTQIPTPPHTMPSDMQNTWRREEGRGGEGAEGGEDLSDELEQRKRAMNRRPHRRGTAQREAKQSGGLTSKARQAWRQPAAVKGNW